MVGKVALTTGGARAVSGWRAAMVALLLAGVVALPMPARATAQSCEHWIAPAPKGSDINPGTASQPWATLKHASVTVPDSHCTVWVEDGIYSGENHLVERYATVTIFRARHPYRAVLQNNGMVINLDGARNIVFEGFEIRHTGPGADALVIKVDRAKDVWSEEIVFRNNIIRDSWNNDLLKLHNGARFVTVEQNLFYNQGESEHHIDANSVTDITIQDNIFFNDYAGSGRVNPGNTKAFITIKDSNGDEDGLEGNERITVRRNVFLNWEGGRETFIQVGNDGKPYHEAEDVLVESNLLIGNSPHPVYAAFGVRGAKNVMFNNNTVVGNLPSSGYAMWVSLKELNPQNQNIVFTNNIWSDPTGSMGAARADDKNEFSNGVADETDNLVLDNNLYWNGGAPIPAGDLLSPLLDDRRRLVADPLPAVDQNGLTLPRWTGTAFLSGHVTIRQEFIRLVEAYGRTTDTSPAIGQADLQTAATHDILGRMRTATPDLGAYEYQMQLTGSVNCERIALQWSDLHEPQAASLSLAYTGYMTAGVITDIPVTVRSYHLTNLPWSASYSVVLRVHDGNGAILAQSTPLSLRMGRECLHIPLIFGFGRGIK